MSTRLLRLFRKLSLWLSFLVLIAAFLLVILWNVMVHTIPVGHSGVVWHRIPIFGGAHSRGPLAEGLHIILPWDKIFVYDMRLQNHTELYQVLSKDGLAFEVELSFRWRLVPEKLVELNQTVGPDYVNTLMVQEIGSVAREITAQYTAEALFTGARTKVQQAIFEAVTKVSFNDGMLSRYGVTNKQDSTLFNSERFDLVALVDILIKNVKLPLAYSQAIERKLEQAQVVEEYRFRVEREALESERKRVEALGIRSFQEIVTPAISESYLRWRGIEATLKLAQSPNSKVVVIGNSATGLPLILDTTTSGATTAPTIGTGAPADNAPTASLDEDMRADQGSVEEIEPKIVPVTPSVSPDVISAPSASAAGEGTQPEGGEPAPAGGN
jgi:regulator of protease activity HflC (stomatin/prohibitin superfamily)